MLNNGVAALRDQPTGIRFGQALRSLEPRQFETYYFAWPAIDGSRVIVSVFPVEPDRPDAGLPDFSDCIVIPVARRGGHRVPLGFVPIERDNDRRSALAFGLAHRAQEWHVHLLAADRTRRRRLVEALRRGQEAAMAAGSIQEAAA